MENKQHYTIQIIHSNNKQQVLTFTNHEDAVRNWHFFEVGFRARMIYRGKVVRQTNSWNKPPVVKRNIFQRLFNR